MCLRTIGGARKKIQTTGKGKSGMEIEEYVSTTPKAEYLKKLDLEWAFGRVPETRDFIFGSFLSGTVGALCGAGAAGKSFWALEMAMAIASQGTEGGDLLRLSPSRPGRVVYVAAEESYNELSYRAHMIGRHIPIEARAAIAEWLDIEVVEGRRINVLDDEYYNQLAQNLCGGARLVILDTLSRIHLGEENSNRDMAILISRLEKLSYETGAAVLYLHHISKATALGGLGGEQQAARGASALIDNARWCGNLTGMSKTEAEKLSTDAYSRLPIGPERRRYFCKFTVSKENYAITDGDTWYQRHEGGVLLPIKLYGAVEDEQSKRGKERERK